MSKSKETTTLVCPTCGNVKPVHKTFGTLVCPKCNIIIGGKYSPNEVKV